MTPDHQLPEIPPERSDDLHHLEWADDCDLVLFMAGNQFMVMPDLISAFQARNPQVRKIFYETLPPRFELRQILAGGATFQGKTISAYPDIYTSVNLASMETLAQSGHIGRENFHLYLHNRLTLMVPVGNPAGIGSVADLGGEEVRISQPDPDGEDIAFHIMNMYRAAGGEALVNRIMKTKKAQGTTLFTVVHHRETPLRIVERSVDVGPVWATEAQYALDSGLEIDIIEPDAGFDQHDKINYYICQTRRSPHAHNAACFMDFIRTDEAQSIYEKFGFVGIARPQVLPGHRGR